ncbi:four-carbon acid sugar kinase family protein [Bacillus licheniformis]|nr:four-carbon acid sugar kinase family protein [Bacillus licheniformis]
MKTFEIAIIADDLTGANDCGGQLVHYGMDVSVKLDAEFTRRETEGVVISIRTADRCQPQRRRRLLKHQ